MKTKPIIAYLKLTCANPNAENISATTALLSAINNPDNEGAVEMWKPSGLQIIPPPGCEIESGPVSGYSRVEAVYVRERPKAILVCIVLEDNFRNNLKTLQKEGWKIWEKGDTEALANPKPSSAPKR